MDGEATREMDEAWRAYLVEREERFSQLGMKPNGWNPRRIFEAGWAAGQVRASGWYSGKE